LPADCDVVVAPDWPPFGQMPTATLAGMAAAKAIVTSETEVTGGWPALDPQTWRPRDLAATDAPIAVTVDPRDEEHSLMLAIRRLSSDPSLRISLGEAAHAWWKRHATPEHAAAAWEQILDEARHLAPPRRPEEWPTAFSRDGSELMREILKEIGVQETGTGS
jgi:glycosyltransferase involved in cell wall biosynthesis